MFPSCSKENIAQRHKLPGPCWLTFMNWCPVLAGDISLRIRVGGREESGWRVNNQSGDRDFVIRGSVPFLGACQKAVIEGKNQVHLI